MHDTQEITTEIASLVQTYLNIEQWGFQESARINEMSNFKLPTVIYNSQWCQIRIEFTGWEPPYQSEEYAIRVYYGRLHAPNNKEIVTWNGEKCWCWYLVDEALHFLDGHSPEYTVENLYPHSVIQKYAESVPSKSFRHNLPEWEIRKHAYIWEHYAPRLFELFDLRRPELWEEYRAWLRACYEAEGRSEEKDASLGMVPYYRVC